MPTPQGTRVSTATPTVTLAEVTPTTAKSVPTNASPFPYPAPRLLAPTNNTTIARVEVELKWETVGDLHADEWYDVQVWKPDEKPHGVGWTNEGRWTMPGDFPSGKYQWRIVVIRGKDGKWLEDLSVPSDTWTLNRQ